MPYIIKNPANGCDDGTGEITFTDDETKCALFEEIDWGYNSVSYRNAKTGKYLNLKSDLTLGCTSESVWGWFTMELFFRDEDSGDFLPHSEAFGNRYNESDCNKIDNMVSKLKRVTMSNGISPAVGAAASADTVIIVLGNHPLINGREGFDRPGLDFPRRWTRLIRQIYAVNPNIVLTLVASYPFTFREEAKLLRAVLYTAHGEQDVGTAVSDVLFGKYNPAGRLSMTWYNMEKDLPDINDYDIINNPRTYMYFDKPVQFPFGHGLSYTKFEYSELTCQKYQGDDSGASENGASDTGYKISCKVKNIEARTGEEVVQLYATLNGVPVKAPIRKLCGFERVLFTPGEEKIIEFSVPDDELRLYDENTASFSIVPESITFAVGASSADIRLVV